MKNEPQIISATLTRNNGVYSSSRVRMGALTPCHESTQIVGSADNGNMKSDIGF